MPPEGIVDVNHPAYDSNGNGPLMDVDSVDTNRDGVAEPPSGIKDMYPLGEKIPGSDKGPGVTAFDMPFSNNGIFLVPMQYITDNNKCK